MSKEKDKILRTLEHIAITFDKFGFSPTIPICTGHKDFNYLFRLEIDTIKELCEQQSQRIAELEEQLKNAIVLPCIKKHTTYLDVDSGFVEVAWYVIFKQNGYGDEIFTIKCRSEEDAIKELKALKRESQSKLEELKG